MGSFSASPVNLARAGISMVLVTQLLSSIGCTGYDGDGESEFALQAEAIELWSESDAPPLSTGRSLDMKAESRSVVWIADRLSGGVFRVDPTRGDYRLMGAEDNPPQEIVQPLRLAVSPEHGVFVFDWATRQVDQFTPGGTPVYSFEPEFVPARMDIVQRPIGIQFTVVDRDGPDSIAQLVVIRTDLRGEQPDTVLFPGVRGPEALWTAPAEPGDLALDAGSYGLWAWSRVAADTVFEITLASTARKRVLRTQDQDPLGILVDSEREILWVVNHGEEGQVRYAAYDTGVPGLVSPEDSYLGERTTTGFDPKLAKDGIVIGRIQSSSGLRPKLAAFDMLVPLKR